MEEKKKKERTIRSETTKVFLVIFVILAVVGSFTIFSALRASRTFSDIREVHLKQFRAAELMKQRALDVIAIYYLLATDQDQELLMRELQRYDGLVESFEQARTSVEKTYAGTSGPEKEKVMVLLAETKQIFDDLNDSCRRMTFAMMEGKKEESAAQLPAINEGIGKFKARLDSIEAIVEGQLDQGANKAQSLLKKATWLGVAITILAVFISLGLIWYLMKFLSISLLPISNLMHNMRQAVFSIDKNLNVISPVSAYSSVVFGEEIVGKNINDIAYKEVDQKAEAYSKNKMALDVVFGADDLQWMLQEDGLMRQVKRTVTTEDGNGQEKILKLTYTPLLEKDLVQNIMIVAEDVTEVEKLRAEALAKQSEMEVIKGVIGVDINDLEAFLTDAQALILECRGLMPKLEADKESRLLLFRILHTLKGNSRMYSLNAISEVVHVAESSVVEMNRQLDSGESLTDEQKMSIKVGLDSIEDVLALHSKMARKLFGLKDLYSGRAEEQLNRAIASIEVGLEERVSVEKIRPMIDTAIKAAQYFEKESVVELLSKLVQENILNLAEDEKFLADLSDEYLKLLLQNGGVRVFTREPSRWISLFQSIVDLSKELVSPGNQSRLEHAVEELLVLADSENMGFIRKKAMRMSKLLSNDGSPDKEALASQASSLWRYMAGVCALDSSYALDEAQALFIVDELSSGPATSGNLDKVTSAKLLPISLLRSLERKSFSQNEFWRLAQLFLDHGNVRESVMAFIGHANSRKNIDEILDQLKDGTATGWKMAVASTSPAFPLFGLIGKEAHSSQLQLDVMRLLASYKTSKDGLSPFENQEQMIEIPVVCFNEIKALAQDLAATPGQNAVPGFNKLHRVIQHAFDYSIQSVCRKMEPMIYDMGKRMGKDIHFKVRGDNVAVARDSAYALRDALVHIIRNSLDHGIETPEERVNNGKPAKANLEIEVLNRNNMIEISVRDDGRGIDDEKLVKKAISIGTLGEADSQKLSFEERLQLVFVANLSTKDEVTALSGRGVGMDAVKNTVDKLGGSINVQSAKGRGTEFKIQIAEADAAH